jgi:hypothetical protein
MRKFIIIYISILFATVQFSCKKELSALPSQSKVEGNVVIDQKSAEIALNGAYLLFADGADDRGTPSVKWALNHEIQYSVLAGNLQYAFGPSEIQENNLITSTGSVVLTIWSTNYKLINVANGVIEQVGALADDKITGSRKSEIIAEARYLRAYGNYNLLRFFSQFYNQDSQYGVMMRTQFVNTDNIAQKRSSVRDTYNAIISDLDFAIGNTNLNRPNYYVNKWVAKGMMARVLMLRGGAGDYAKVFTITQDIINNSPYRLEDNLKDIFSLKGIDSKEVMLGITPKPNQTTKQDANIFYTSPQYLVTNYFKSLFPATDPRPTWLIGAPSPTGESALTKYQGGYAENSYAMRLTEIYLLQAEAIVRSGGSLSDARLLLKTILNHAGVTDVSAVDAAISPQSLLVEIYKEVARNLSFEDGQDWTTLTRLPLTTVQQFKPSVVDLNHMILPIPATEFQYNPTIGDQNPGYSKF